MLQIGRNLTDGVSGFLLGKRFLIMDRDALYHDGFRRMLEQAGVRPVRTPPSWRARISIRGNESGIQKERSADGRGWVVCLTTIIVTPRERFEFLDGTRSRVDFVAKKDCVRP